MIGLVLVTHGRLAEEFRSALEHVVGPQQNLVTVAIGPDDELEKRRAALAPLVTPDWAKRGYAHLFNETILQADEGCDFDFMRSEGKG